MSSAWTGLKNRLDCSKPTSDSSDQIRKQAGSRRRVDHVWNPCASRSGMPRARQYPHRNEWGGCRRWRSGTRRTPPWSWSGLDHERSPSAKSSNQRCCGTMRWLAGSNSVMAGFSCRGTVAYRYRRGLCGGNPLNSSWPGLSRPSTSLKRLGAKHVDGRNKSGHDVEREPLPHHS